MSQQVIPVAVRDTVLDLDDKVHYAVLRGGQNISVQKYNALSASSSQMTFNVQVPSTSTIMSRNVVFGSTITFTVEGTPGMGEYLVNFRPVNCTGSNGAEPPAKVELYGADCFAPFPLNQLVQNFSATINNTTVSTNTNQILDVLLRSVDKSYFERWNGSTPTQLDKYGSYYQSLPQQVVTNIVPSAENNTNNLQAYTIPAENSPFNNFDIARCSNAIVPRNAFIVTFLNLGQGNPNNSVGDGVNPRKAVFSITVREPLFVSPFIFNEHVDAPGLSGITTINCTAQIDSSARRALRWVCDNQMQNKRITGLSFSDTYLECTYYTPKPSDMVPAVVVTPLSSYTLYNMPNPGSTACPVNVSQTLDSNSITFNSYPDRIWIYVEPVSKRNVASGNGAALNTAGNGVSDCYFSINKIEITLNNQSGILTTYDGTQLFRASLQSGSQQSYDEFSGLQTGFLFANANTGTQNQNISTCGSVLCADFGSVINIAQDYFSAGSLSTVQFQCKVTFTNNLQAPFVPQLNILVQQTGILSTQNGSSAQYVSGILSKEAVLNASAVPKPMNKHTLVRYVGSGLAGSLKAISSSLLPMLKKDVVAPVAEHLAEKAMSRLAAKLKK